MGYVGGSLRSLFDAKAQAATKEAVMAMAEKGGSRMKELAEANTPIDTGELRSSWYQIPVHPTSFVVWDAWASGVASDVSYAPYVEYGTGIYGPKHAPYIIRPKNPGGLLVWTDPKTGRIIRAKEVLHPGSPGQHMVAIAADVTEFEADTGLFDGVLNTWGAAIEGGAD